MTEPSRRRVAITIFAEVDAVSDNDAAYIVSRAIHNALQTCSVEPDRFIVVARFDKGDVRVTIVGAHETGDAIANGYLRIEPSAKAFRWSE